MIRDAVMEDLEQCIEISKDYIIETRHKDSHIEFNEDKLYETLYYAIHCNDHLFFVYEKDGEIYGGIIATLYKPYFSNDYVAQDLLVLVKKKYRGSMIASRLLKEYKKRCEARGVKEIILQIMSGITEERTKKFYERIGFKNIGTIHSMELNK